MDNDSLFYDVHESLVSEYQKAALTAETNSYSRSDISAPHLALAKYCKGRLVEGTNL